MGTLAVLIAVAACVALVAFRMKGLPSYVALLDETEEAPPLAPSAIGAAPREGRAAFQGVVGLWEAERRLLAPDDSPAVWLEVLIETGAVDPDTRQVTSYAPVLFFVDAVPFGLEDATGRVRVVPKGGRLARGASTQDRRRAEGDTLRWLHDLLVAQNKAVDERLPLFYAEARICIGDRIIVRGAVTHEEPSESYRTSAKPTVTLRAGAEPLVIARVIA